MAAFISDSQSPPALLSSATSWRARMSSQIFLALPVRPAAARSSTTAGPSPASPLNLDFDDDVDVHPARGRASRASVSSARRISQQSVSRRTLGSVTVAALGALNEAVVACRRCPRLVEWREQVAREKRAADPGGNELGRPPPRLARPPAPGLVPRVAAPPPRAPPTAPA